MKFGIITYLMLNNILATNQSIKHGNKSSEEESNLISELIELAFRKDQLQYTIESIMDYLCDNLNRNKHKSAILSNIANIYNSNIINLNEKPLYKSLLNDINNNANLYNFSQEIFNNIYMSYYYYNFNIKSYRVLENKKIFQEILKKRTDIHNLTLNFPLLSKDDPFNLLAAIGENLRDLKLIKPTDSILLKILKKCKKSLKSHIKISLINFIYDSLTNIGISNLLGNLDLSSLTIMDSDLRSITNISFFKYLKNIKNLKELIISKTKISKKDSDYIIDTLTSNETSLNTLFLNNLIIDQDLLCELLNSLINNQKVEVFLFENEIITLEITKSILNILKFNNFIKSLSLSSNKIDIENVNLIAEELKTNSSLIVIYFSSYELSLKGFTLILNGILENPESKIEKIFFKSKKDIFILASEKDQKEFKKAVERLLKWSKDIEIQFNNQFIN